MTDTSAPSLDVGLAIRDGWQAFCRAPWPFVGFVMVLVGLLAAVPLTFCISGAAYRQLFGTEDQAGLLNGQ